jgi:YegS/Rv2252/BmrU family lipid kinase
VRTNAAILVNPASGILRARARGRKLRELLQVRGLRAELHETRAAGDARAWAASVSRKVDVIVSVGGDGTLNEVVRGLLDAEMETPVLVVPSGTGNVVWGELGLPKRLEALADVVAEGAVRRLDVGVAGRLPFVMCAGIGFDAEIVRRVHRARDGRGLTLLSYSWPALATLLGYGYPAFRVRVDGAWVEEAATFVVIGNLRRYGGPFRFFRKARPDDGVLDLCCVHGRGFLRYLRYGWKAFRQTLDADPGTSYHTARDVRIEAADPGHEVCVQVDGDPAGALPVDVTIRPGAVRFCVPRGKTGEASPT